MQLLGDGGFVDIGSLQRHISQLGMHFTKLQKMGGTRREDAGIGQGPTEPATSACALPCLLNGPADRKVADGVPHDRYSRHQRDTIGEQRAKCSCEAGGLHLTAQRANQRQAQQQAISPHLHRWQPQRQLQCQHHNHQQQAHPHAVGADNIAQGNHHPGQLWKLGAVLLEQRDELRQHPG